MQAYQMPKRITETKDGGTKIISDSDGTEMLEKYSDAGAFYFDLESMTFTEASDYLYNQIYGFDFDVSITYELILQQVVVFQDKEIIEKFRMKIISDDEYHEESWRIIHQKTGEVFKITSICKRVLDKNKKVKGIRGVTKRLKG